MQHRRHEAPPNRRLKLTGAQIAVRNGAKRVDVVEIDPVIAELGKELHADKPYQSKAVRLFVDDARSFLQRQRSKYDLVIFATLDSHTAFSSLSSLRLDNFVFTVESLRQAAQHLNPGGGEGVDWHLFFMGAAFLLIETKAVTALGLLFGSTWLLNSIVIGAILVMILVANALAPMFTRVSFTTLYALLSLTLLVNYLFPLTLFNQFDWGYRIVAGAMLVTCPLFIAALIFARAFAQVKLSSAALASNLFGALVGGLLEYLDMWTGLSWLNLIALTLYLLSYWFLLRSQRAGAPAMAGPPGRIQATTNASR